MKFSVLCGKRVLYNFFPVELNKSFHNHTLLNFYFAVLEISKNMTVKAINNGSACSVLFLSTTGLFPAQRKILVRLVL